MLNITDRFRYELVMAMWCSLYCYSSVAVITMISHFECSVGSVLLWRDDCLQGMALSMGDKINLSQKKNKMDIVK